MASRLGEGETDTRRRWIKREPWTEVWVEGGVCHKRYIVPQALRWRTIGRKARARREFENLNRLRVAGIPAIEALDWTEKRRRGQVVESTLVTRWEEGTCNLKEWLKAPVSDGVLLSRRMGEILRRMHRRGMVWNTASPRNWLIRGDGSGEGGILLCDVSLLTMAPVPVYAKKPGWVDLFSLSLSRDRAQWMSRGFRYRSLLSYCEGDRELARRLWRVVTTWRRSSFRRRKGWNLIFENLRGVRK